MTDQATQPREDWLEALAAECRRQKSQAKVAHQLGVSPALVNQVLKGVYQGDMERIRDLVEGQILGATVDCPVLGDLPRHRCRENQGKPFAATNPVRVALYHTCPTCPNRRRT